MQYRKEVPIIGDFFSKNIKYAGLMLLPLALQELHDSSGDIDTTHYVGIRLRSSYVASYQHTSHAPQFFPVHTGDLQARCSET